MEQMQSLLLIDFIGDSFVIKVLRTGYYFIFMSLKRSLLLIWGQLPYT